MVCKENGMLLKSTASAIDQFLAQIQQVICRTTLSDAEWPDIWIVL